MSFFDATSIWIDDWPPSLPRRFISASVMSCACSSRGLEAVTFTPFKDSSNASKTMPFARSPIAWTFWRICQARIDIGLKREDITNHLPAITQEFRNDVEQNIRIEAHEPFGWRVVSIGLVELMNMSAKGKFIQWAVKYLLRLHRSSKHLDIRSG